MCVHMLASEKSSLELEESLGLEAILVGEGSAKSDKENNQHEEGFEIRMHKKIFLVDDNGIISTFEHTRDYHEHVISQLVDMNLGSKSRIAPRESDSELKCLQCELEMQSQELMSVKEQLHLVKLAFEEEEQKSLEQFEKIKELQQSLAKERQKAK